MGKTFVYAPKWTKKELEKVIAGDDFSCSSNKNIIKVKLADDKRNTESPTIVAIGALVTSRSEEGGIVSLTSSPPTVMRVTCNPLAKVTVNEKGAVTAYETNYLNNADSEAPLPEVCALKLIAATAYVMAGIGRKGATEEEVINKSNGTANGTAYLCSVPSLQFPPSTLNESDPQQASQVYTGGIAFIFAPLLADEEPLPPALSCFDKEPLAGITNSVYQHVTGEEKKPSFTAVEEDLKKTSGAKRFAEIVVDGKKAWVDKDFLRAFYQQQYVNYALAMYDYANKQMSEKEMVVLAFTPFAVAIGIEKNFDALKEIVMPLVKEGMLAAINELCAKHAEIFDVFGSFEVYGLSGIQQADLREKRNKLVDENIGKNKDVPAFKFYDDVSAVKNSPSLNYSDAVAFPLTGHPDEFLGAVEENSTNSKIIDNLAGGADEFLNNVDDTKMGSGELPYKEKKVIKKKEEEKEEEKEKIEKIEVIEIKEKGLKEEKDEQKKKLDEKKNYTKSQQFMRRVNTLLSYVSGEGTEEEKEKKEEIVPENKKHIRFKSFIFNNILNIAPLHSALELKKKIKEDNENLLKVALEIRDKINEGSLSGSEEDPYKNFLSLMEKIKNNYSTNQMVNDECKKTAGFLEEIYSEMLKKEESKKDVNEEIKIEEEKKEEKEESVTWNKICEKFPILVKATDVCTLYAEIVNHVGNTTGLAQKIEKFKEVYKNQEEILKSIEDLKPNETYKTYASKQLSFSEHDDEDGVEHEKIEPLGNVTVSDEVEKIKFDVEQVVNSYKEEQQHIGTVEKYLKILGCIESTVKEIQKETELNKKIDLAQQIENIKNVGKNDLNNLQKIKERSGGFSPIQVVEEELCEQIIQYKQSYQELAGHLQRQKKNQNTNKKQEQKKVEKQEEKKKLVPTLQDKVGELNLYTTILLSHVQPKNNELLVKGNLKQALDKLKENFAKGNFDITFFATFLPLLEQTINSCVPNKAAAIESAYRQLHTFLINVIAETFTKYEIDFFNSISAEEWVNKDNFTSKTGKFKEAADRLNHLSNATTAFVLTGLLALPEDEQKKISPPVSALKDYVGIARRIESMVLLAWRCCEMGNFVTAQQICSALFSSSIIRLTHVQEYLSPLSKQYLDKLQGFFSGAQNFKQLKIALQDKKQQLGFVIPPLSPLQTAITFAHDGNKSNKTAQQEAIAKIVSGITEDQKILQGHTDAKSRQKYLHEFIDSFVLAPQKPKGIEIKDEIKEKDEKKLEEEKLKKEKQLEDKFYSISKNTESPNVKLPSPHNVTKDAYSDPRYGMFLSEEELRALIVDLGSKSLSDFINKSENINHGKVALLGWQVNALRELLMAKRLLDTKSLYKAINNILQPTYEMSMETARNIKQEILRKKIGVLGEFIGKSKDKNISQDKINKINELLSAALEAAGEPNIKKLNECFAGIKNNLNDVQLNSVVANIFGYFQAKYGMLVTGDNVTQTHVLHIAAQLYVAGIKDKNSNMERDGFAALYFLKHLAITEKNYKPGLQWQNAEGKTPADIIYESWKSSDLGKDTGLQLKPWQLTLLHSIEEDNFSKLTPNVEISAQKSEQKDEEEKQENYPESYYLVRRVLRELGKNLVGAEGAGLKQIFIDNLLKAKLDEKNKIVKIIETYQLLKELLLKTKKIKGMEVKKEEKIAEEKLESSSSYFSGITSIIGGVTSSITNLVYSPVLTETQKEEQKNQQLRLNIFTLYYKQVASHTSKLTAGELFKFLADVIDVFAKPPVNIKITNGDELYKQLREQIGINFLDFLLQNFNFKGLVAINVNLIGLVNEIDQCKEIVKKEVEKTEINYGEKYKYIFSAIAINAAEKINKDFDSNLQSILPDFIKNEIKENDKKKIEEKGKEKEEIKIDVEEKEIKKIKEKGEVIIEKKEKSKEEMEGKKSIVDIIFPEKITIENNHGFENSLQRLMCCNKFDKESSDAATNKNKKFHGIATVGYEKRYLDAAVRTKCKEPLDLYNNLRDRQAKVAGKYEEKTLQYVNTLLTKEHNVVSESSSIDNPPPKRTYIELLKDIANKIKDAQKSSHDVDISKKPEKKKKKTYDTSYSESDGIVIKHGGVRLEELKKLKQEYENAINGGKNDNMAIGGITTFLLAEKNEGYKKFLKNIIGKKSTEKDEGEDKKENTSKLVTADDFKMFLHSQKIVQKLSDKIKLLEEDITLQQLFKYPDVIPNQKLAQAICNNIAYLNPELKSLTDNIARNKCIEKIKEICAFNIGVDFDSAKDLAKKLNELLFIEPRIPEKGKDQTLVGANEIKEEVFQNALGPLFGSWYAIKENTQCNVKQVINACKEFTLQNSGNGKNEKNIESIVSNLKETVLGGGGALNTYLESENRLPFTINAYYKLYNVDKNKNPNVLLVALQNLAEGKREEAKAGSDELKKNTALAKQRDALIIVHLIHYIKNAKSDLISDEQKSQLLDKHIGLATENTKDEAKNLYAYLDNKITTEKFDANDILLQLPAPQSGNETSKEDALKREFVLGYTRAINGKINCDQDLTHKENAEKHTKTNAENIFRYMDKLIKAATECGKKITNGKELLDILKEKISGFDGFFTSLLEIYRKEETVSGGVNKEGIFEKYIEQVNTFMKDGINSEPKVDKGNAKIIFEALLIHEAEKKHLTNPNAELEKYKYDTLIPDITKVAKGESLAIKSNEDLRQRLNGLNTMLQTKFSEKILAPAKSIKEPDVSSPLKVFAVIRSLKEGNKIHDDVMNIEDIKTPYSQYGALMNLLEQYKESIVAYVNAQLDANQPAGQFHALLVKIEEAIKPVEEVKIEEKKGINEEVSKAKETVEKLKLQQENLLKLQQGYNQPLNNENNDQYASSSVIGLIGVSTEKDNTSLLGQIIAEEKFKQLTLLQTHKDLKKQLDVKYPEVLEKLKQEQERVARLEKISEYISAGGGESKFEKLYKLLNEIKEVKIEDVKTKAINIKSEIDNAKNKITQWENYLKQLNLNEAQDFFNIVNKNFEEVGSFLKKEDEDKLNVLKTNAEIKFNLQQKIANINLQIIKAQEVLDKQNVAVKYVKGGVGVDGAANKLCKLLQSIDSNHITTNAIQNNQIQNIQNEIVNLKTQINNKTNEKNNLSQIGVVNVTNLTEKEINKRNLERYIQVAEQDIVKLEMDQKIKELTIKIEKKEVEVIDIKIAPLQQCLDDYKKEMNFSDINNINLKLFFDQITTTDEEKLENAYKFCEDKELKGVLDLLGNREILRQKIENEKTVLQDDKSTHENKEILIKNELNQIQTKIEQKKLDIENKKSEMILPAKYLAIHDYFTTSLLNKVSENQKLVKAIYTDINLNLIDKLLDARLTVNPYENLNAVKQQYENTKKILKESVTTVQGCAWTNDVVATKLKEAMFPLSSMDDRNGENADTNFPSFVVGKVATMRLEESKNELEKLGDLGKALFSLYPADAQQIKKWPNVKELQDKFTTLILDDTTDKTADRKKITTDFLDELVRVKLDSNEIINNKVSDQQRRQLIDDNWNVLNAGFTQCLNEALKEENEEEEENIVSSKYGDNPLYAAFALLAKSKKEITNADNNEDLKKAALKKQSNALFIIHSILYAAEHNVDDARKLLHRSLLKDEQLSETNDDIRVYDINSSDKLYSILKDEEIVGEENPCDDDLLGLLDYCKMVDNEEDEEERENVDEKNLLIRNVVQSVLVRCYKNNVEEDENEEENPSVALRKMFDKLDNFFGGIDGTAQINIAFNFFNNLLPEEGSGDSTVIPFRTALIKEYIDAFNESRQEQSLSQEKQVNQLFTHMGNMLDVFNANQREDDKVKDGAALFNALKSIGKHDGDEGNFLSDFLILYHEIHGDENEEEEQTQKFDIYACINAIKTNGLMEEVIENGEMIMRFTNDVNGKEQIIFETLLVQSADKINDDFASAVEELKLIGRLDGEIVPVGEIIKIPAINSVDNLDLTLLNYLEIQLALKEKAIQTFDVIYKNNYDTDVSYYFTETNQNYEKILKSCDDYKDAINSYLIDQNATPQKIYKLLQEVAAVFKKFDDENIWDGIKAEKLFKELHKYEVGEDGKTFFKVLANSFYEDLLDGDYTFLRGEAKACITLCKEHEGKYKTLEKIYGNLTKNPKVYGVLKKECVKNNCGCINDQNIFVTCPTNVSEQVVDNNLNGLLVTNNFEQNEINTVKSNIKAALPQQLVDSPFPVQLFGDFTNQLEASGISTSWKGKSVKISKEGVGANSKTIMTCELDSLEIDYDGQKLPFLKGKVTAKFELVDDAGTKKFKLVDMRFSGRNALDFRRILVNDKHYINNVKEELVEEKKQKFAVRMVVMHYSNIRQYLQDKGKITDGDANWRKKITWKNIYNTFEKNEHNRVKFGLLINENLSKTSSVNALGQLENQLQAVKKLRKQLFPYQGILAKYNEKSFYSPESKKQFKNLQLINDTLIKKEECLKYQILIANLYVEYDNFFTYLLSQPLTDQLSMVKGKLDYIDDVIKEKKSDQYKSKDRRNTLLTQIETFRKTFSDKKDAIEEKIKNEGIREREIRGDINFVRLDEGEVNNLGKMPSSDLPFFVLKGNENVYLYGEKINGERSRIRINANNFTVKEWNKLKESFPKTNGKQLRVSGENIPSKVYATIVLAGYRYTAMDKLVEVSKLVIGEVNELLKKLPPLPHERDKKLREYDKNIRRLLNEIPLDVDKQIENLKLELDSVRLSFGNDAADGSQLQKKIDALTNLQEQLTPLITLKDKISEKLRTFINKDQAQKIVDAVGVKEKQQEIINKISMQQSEWKETIDNLAKQGLKSTWADPKVNNPSSSVYLVHLVAKMQSCLSTLSEMRTENLGLISTVQKVDGIDGEKIRVFPPINLITQTPEEAEAVRSGEQGEPTFFSKAKINQIHVLNRGIDYTNATVRILNSYLQMLGKKVPHPSQAKLLDIHEAFEVVKSNMLNFRERLAAIDPDKDLEALDSAMNELTYLNQSLSDTLVNLGVVDTHEQADAAIPLVSGLIWQRNVVSEDAPGGWCSIVNDEKGDLSMVDVMKVPCLQNSQSSWTGRGKKLLEKELEQSCGNNEGWLTLFLADVGAENLSPPPTPPRQLGNMPNVKDHTLISVKSGDDGDHKTVSGITTATTSGIAEPFDVEDKDIKQGMTMHNEERITADKEIEDAVSKFVKRWREVIGNKIAKGKSQITLPWLVQTLVMDDYGMGESAGKAIGTIVPPWTPTDFKKSTTILENKQKALEKLQEYLNKKKIYVSGTGETITIDRNTATPNNTALKEKYLEVKFDVMDINNNLHTWNIMGAASAHSTNVSRRLLENALEFVESYVGDQPPGDDVKITKDIINKLKNLGKLGILDKFGHQGKDDINYLRTIFLAFAKEQKNGQYADLALLLLAMLELKSLHWRGGIENMRLKSAYEILIAGLLGNVRFGCMSGCDRTGETWLLVMSMREQFNTKGTIINYDIGKQALKDIVEKAAKRYSHVQNNATLMGTGAPGVSNAESKSLFKTRTRFSEYVDHDDAKMHEIRKFKTKVKNKRIKTKEKIGVDKSDFKVDSKEDTKKEGKGYVQTIQEIKKLNEKKQRKKREEKDVLQENIIKKEIDEKIQKLHEQSREFQEFRQQQKQENPHNDPNFKSELDIANDPALQLSEVGKNPPPSVLTVSIVNPLLGPLGQANSKSVPWLNAGIAPPITFSYPPLNANGTPSSGVVLNSVGNIATNIHNVVQHQAANVVVTSHLAPNGDRVYEFKHPNGRWLSPGEFQNVLTNVVSDVTRSSSYKEIPLKFEQKNESLVNEGFLSGLQRHLQSMQPTTPSSSSSSNEQSDDSKPDNIMKDLSNIKK